MKRRLAIRAMLVALPAVIGLIVGASALAQQEKKDTASSGTQGTPQDTTRAKGADKATQTNRNQSTDEFTKAGMYDEYRTHWNARFRDPDFVSFQEQQLKLVAPNSAPNRQGTTTYQQFSEDTALWVSRERGGEAWHRSDAYWRMSDRYWRDPERRSKNSDDYWMKSEAYWRDSDRYWDMYYTTPNRDDSVNPSDQERTNR